MHSLTQTAGIVATPINPCFNSCKATEALCAPTFQTFQLTFPPWCVHSSLVHLWAYLEHQQVYAVLWDSV